MGTIILMPIILMGAYRCMHIIRYYIRFFFLPVCYDCLCFCICVCVFLSRHVSLHLAVAVAVLVLVLVYVCVFVSVSVFVFSCLALSSYFGIVLSYLVPCFGW